MSYCVVRIGGALAAAALTLGLLAAPALAQNDAPITIGLAMSVTGPLAPNGKQALAGAKIWEEETNAKGGLLGRPVQLDRTVLVSGNTPAVELKFAAANLAQSRLKHYCFAADFFIHTHIFYRFSGLTQPTPGSSGR